MPSLGSILSIARTGLAASQKAIDVSAHNIANATTEGYTRQRVDLRPKTPLRLADGIYGTGVSVRDVERLRDSFLDTSFRRESSSGSRYEARNQVLVRLEGLMAEPGDDGLGAALDGFFSGFSELASNPTSPTLRTLVVAEAQTVTREFHRLSEGIDSLREEAEDRLSSGIDRVNDLVESIADLNRQVVTAEADGFTAGDLRDQRDLALDELAELVAITSSERADGSVGVHLAGISVADSTTFRHLEVAVAPGGEVQVRAQGSTRSLDVGGSLAGYADVLNTDLPETRAALDRIAAELVAQVNAVHTTGVPPDGTTDPADLLFFSAPPGGVRASNIEVAPDRVADPTSVVAGTGSALDEYRPGANDVALAIAGLRDADLAALGGASLRGFHGALVSDVGQAVRFSDDSASVHRSLAEQSSLRRQSVSGVSTDEELVNLIQFQAAYGAAARVVTVADEMMQTLLSI
jgi:flagellar hook-associated protein 1 FlgK